MYRVIGADGKEYGPISTDQLRQWIAQSRANAQTQVKPEGAADWQTLGSLPEFAADFPAAPLNQPAPFIAAPRPMQPAKTSGMAIASLVLGISGFLCAGFTSLIGLILGIIALVQIGKSEGRLGGKGLALAGTIVSGIMLLLMPIIAIPAFARAKQKALTANCINNVKALDQAIIVYESKNGRLPPAESWCSAVENQLGSDKAFRCVAGDQSSRSQYAFNARLDGLRLSQVSNKPATVLVFETEGGWNVSGGPERMLQHSRHGRGIVVGFTDGHIELISGERLNQLRWDP